MSTSYDPQNETTRGRRDALDGRDDPDLRDRELRDRNLRDRDVRDGDLRDRDLGDRDLRDRDGVDATRPVTSAPMAAGAPGTAATATPRHGRDLHDQPTVVTDSRAAAADLGLDRRAVVARERAEFGGMKIGSAFFGWLAATGMAVLLTALLAGIGVAIGLGTETDPGDAANQATNNPEAVSLAGAVALIAILFVAYYCGGYVAGRMARFNGARQGLAVWLWALLVAIVVAVVAAVAGDKFDVLARLNGFPRLPVNEGELPTAGIVTALALAAASLVGAILGGMAGMRFHRRVDRAGLEPVPAETVDDRTA